MIRLISRSKKRLTLAGALLGMAIGASLAAAYYTNTGAGTANASASTLNAPTNVQATATPGSGTVPVTWTASASGGSAVAPQGYYVLRYSGSTPSAACGTSPTSLTTSTSCNDTSVPDGTYTYTVVAKFNSWTSESAPSSSVTVVNDNTPPTTTITFPVNNVAYNAAGFSNQCGGGTVTGICGTASDPSGVSSVKVAIENSGLQYWNGSSFVASATPIFNPATGTTSWSYAFTPPLNDTYKVLVQATDGVGNATAPGTETTASFTYDTAAPTSTITFPGAGPYNATSWNAGATSKISGTASDPAPSSGLANVKVSIQKVGGNYWGGSSFNSAAEVKTTASGTSSWTLAFAAANFAAAGGGDGSYTVRVYASDNAGNTQATPTSQTFSYDNTPPPISREVVADATADTAGFIKQGGTYYAYAQVTDATSGVSTVTADLHTTTTGASSVAMSTSGGPWTIGGNSYNYRSTIQTANASMPESGNPYGFSINASDNASNSSTASSTVSVDNSGPTGGSVTINGLVGTGSLYSTSTSLSLSLSAGTDGGVGNAASATFVLKRARATLSSSDGIANGACGSFGAFTTIATGPTASYTDNAAGGIATGNCYRYQYMVTDRLGNQTTYTSNVDAKIDTSAPTVSSVTPSNATGNTFIGGSTVWVNGQAGKSGAFDVAASASDSQSGILKVNFPAFGATGSTDVSSSPYSQHYTWSGTVTAGSKTVTATNNATLTNTGSFTVTSDTTNPTGGTITANGSGSSSFNTSGNVSLAVANFGDGAGSGMASNVVTRASATLTNGACGSFSGSTVVSGSSDTGLASGCYQYTLTGTDNVGNTATATSAIVTVDTAAPTSALSFPTTAGPFNATSWNAGATSKISGTASDASPSSGLANVKISIQKVGGNYWNGTTFGSASEVKTTAAGTNSWTLAFAAANFATTGGGDGSYTVRVYATDNAGNIQGTATSQTFVYDNTAPNVSVTFPAASGTFNGSGWTSGGTSPCGASGTICGQATDATSGISGPSSITLTVTRSSNSTTWNGTSFASGSNTAHPTTYNSGTGLWTYTFPSGNFPADDTYSVAVAATDAAGNTSGASTNSFLYDNTPPTVTMVAQNATGVSLQPTFSGNAGNQAASTIASADGTQITIYVCTGTQSSCNQNSGTLAQTYTTTRTGTTWTFTPGINQALFTNTTYTAQAAQSDGAGNTGTSSVTTFTTTNSFTVSAAGSYVLTVAPHVTSFTFTIKGAGGGGATAAGAAGGFMSGTVHVPDSGTPTNLNVVVGGGGGGETNVGGNGGSGCANGGAGGTHGSTVVGGAGGAATCVLTSGNLPIVVVGGGGGGGDGAGGAGSGADTGTNGTVSGGTGGTGGKTSTLTGGPGGTGGGIFGSSGVDGGANGIGGSDSHGSGGNGGSGSGSGNSGGGGGGGYASGGGGAGGKTGSSGGAGGGSGYSSGSGGFTVSGVSTGSAGNSGGTAGGGNGTAGSVTFTGGGLTDPPPDPANAGPPPPVSTDTNPTDTTTTDTTTTNTTTTDTTTTSDTTTTDTTTTDTATTDPTTTAACTTDTTTTDTTATDTTTTTADTTTTTDPACAGTTQTSGTSTAGLSTPREVLFFGVLGGSVLGVIALLTMPIPRRRRARRRRKT